MTSLLGVVVTARLIMVIARAIISDIGTYYSASLIHSGWVKILTQLVFLL